MQLKKRLEGLRQQSSNIRRIVLWKRNVDFFFSVALKDATGSNRLWGSGFVLTRKNFLLYLPKYVLSA